MCLAKQSIEFSTDEEISKQYLESSKQYELRKAVVLSKAVHSSVQIEDSLSISAHAGQGPPNATMGRASSPVHIQDIQSVMCRVGQNHIYIRCIYSIIGREIIKYKVIYGLYIRFWPTLVMCQYAVFSFSFQTVYMATVRYRPKLYCMVEGEMQYCTSTVC